MRFTHHLVGCGNDILSNHCNIDFGPDQSLHAIHTNFTHGEAINMHIDFTFALDGNVLYCMMPLTMHYHYCCIHQLIVLGFLSI